MQLRIEKTQIGNTSSMRHLSRDQLKYRHKYNGVNKCNSRTVRQSQSYKKLTGSLVKYQQKYDNTLRTLLGDMTNLRKYINTSEQKLRRTTKQNNNDSCTREYLITTTHPEEIQNTNQMCEIRICCSTHSEKIYYHKATNGQKLMDFLSERYPKIKIWKTKPTDISMDYYLTLSNTDLSFLNTQILTLQPYKIQSHPKITLSSFDIIHCIGIGGFSKVYLCRFKQDGKFYAMKVIDKTYIIKKKKKKIVINQKKIMEKLKHRFIMEMKFSFQTKSYLIFILEFYPGGELFGLVKKFKVMKESVAKFYLVEILIGLQEIHRNAIVYRDFKPQNILIDIDGHIRIADFGLAKPGILSPKDRAYSFCGSPQYMPPQMIMKNGHSLPVDFYCIGALLYELVTGLPPFYSQNSEQIYEGTISQPVVFPPHAKISQQLKQLLKALLCKDQHKRLGFLHGVKQILNHRWFKQIDIEIYRQKKIDAPVKFTGIKDLKLIFEEMEVQDSQLINKISVQQKNQGKKSYELVMENFFYDYREHYRDIGSSKINKLGQRKSRDQNRSYLNFNSYRSSSYSKDTRENRHRNNKSLKSIFSQRSLSGNPAIMQHRKPLTTRFLDVNLYLR